MSQNVVTTSADPALKPTGARTPTDALEVIQRMSISDDDDNQSGEQHECPECGDVFDTWHGVKVHYGVAHDGTLRPTFECEWCGSEFSVKPKDADTARFCSKKCKYDAMRGGERPPADKLERLHYNQGLSLSELADHFGVGGHQTVARWFDHHGLDYRDNTEANRKLNAERDDYDEIVQSAHATVREAVENGEWHTQVDDPSDHPSWKGGYTRNRDTNWPELRSKALDECGWECQGCGRSEEDHQDEHGVGLSVHHIFPVRWFKTPEDADTIDNLVALCRSCHDRWEGVPLRPQLLE